MHDGREAHVDTDSEQEKTRASRGASLPLGMAWLVISSETLLVFRKISTDRVLS